MNVEGLDYLQTAETSLMKTYEDDVSFIVYKLSLSPFNINLRLIDFASKTGFELVELLNIVLHEIDTSPESHNFLSVAQNDKDIFLHVQTDPSQNDYEMASFLVMLKCPCIPHDEKQCRQWFKMIHDGDRAAVYPLMKWMLGSLEKLKKRAYLIPYLAPIDIPPSLLMSSTEPKQRLLLPLLERYRSLQTEFKRLHSKYDSEYYKEQINTIQTLKSHIDRLASEKKQLMNDIQQQRENNRVSNDKNFLNMLDSITASRKVQQDNTLLKEGLREQTELLSAEDSKVKAMKRYFDKLHDLTITSMLDPSFSKPSDEKVDQILNVLRCEVEQVKTVIFTQLGDSCEALEKEILKLESDTLVPFRTKEDVEDVRDVLKKLQRDLEAKKELAFESQTMKFNILDKVLLLMKEAENSSVNVQRKEAEVLSKRERVDKLRIEIIDLAKVVESRINNDDEEGGFVYDGSVIPKKKLNDLQVSHELKTHQLAAIARVLERRSNEAEIIKRTNEILSERYLQTEENFMRMEEKNAIVDMYDTSNCLTKTAEEEVNANTLKCDKLNEINDMVKTITTNLESNKDTYKPMIQNLKTARYMASDLELKFLQKKACYDKTSSFLMSLQEKLENECDIIQEKWLCVERRYHYLDNMIHIVTSNLQLTALETRCLQGHEIYSFDFPSMEALYNSQIAENEIKAQTLQLQLKKMEDNEVFNIQQRKMFLALQKVLHIRKAIDKRIIRHAIPIQIQRNGLYSF